MPEIMIAVRPGMVVLDGKRQMVRKGRTTAHATHPIVTEHPALWAPLAVDYPVDEPEPAVTGQPAPAAVRAWAAGNGVDVPARGKLPAAVVDAYRAAQQGN